MRLNYTKLFFSCKIRFAYKHQQVCFNLNPIIRKSNQKDENVHIFKCTSYKFFLK
jgi:hypothetical protein